ncbi:MAG: cellulase family glycosylhydrolase, partial [Xanthomonadales bacterium]
MKRRIRTVLAWALAVAASTAAADFEHFISVDGHRLMDGPETFRFVSFNVPTLLYVEDEMAFAQTNPYDLPTEWELRDLFETIVQTGGRVVRAYTIPVRNANFPDAAVTYVEAPGQFNETAFRAMDRALALAAEYGVRVIVPLVNNWQWMGGRPNYAAFRGKPPDAFWTDRQLIDDFKQTIRHVLTRTNTVTGVAYRDDPTILAWETGNELQNPPEWALEIGAYIKRLDSNHLLIDGHHGDHDARVQPYTLESPLFDIVSTHHYEPSGVDMVRSLERTVAMIDGRKPLLLGEFGFISTTGVQEVLDYVLAEPAIAGALIWSLRRHHEDGGFYHHTEPIGHGLYRAYHWPGFDSGD